MKLHQAGEAVAEILGYEGLEKLKEKMKQDGHQSEIQGKINKGLGRSEKKASAGI